MEGMQRFASDDLLVESLPALAYTAAHGDIIASGSSRDIDHMRTTILDDFEAVKGADAVFNIEVTKSKRGVNTKFALRDVGIRKRNLNYLKKGSTFRKIFKSLGCCPELVDASNRITNNILLAVSMRKRTKAVKPNTLQKQFTERLYQLWDYLGLSETKRKANGITGHSPHSTSNCVAKQLTWSERQCVQDWVDGRSLLQQVTQTMPQHATSLFSGRALYKRLMTCTRVGIFLWNQRLTS